MRSPLPKTEPVRTRGISRRSRQDRGHRPLDYFVFQGGDRKRALPTVRLGDLHPPGWHCPIRSPMKPREQALQITLEYCLVVRPCQPIHTGRGVVLEFEERLLKQVETEAVEERSELLPPRMRSSAFPGPVPGACFAVPPSPWPLPFAPPTPQPVARPCSPASQLLWQSLTSRARTSSATAPHLPDACMHSMI